MAEAVGLAASISGLADITAQILARMYCYFDEVWKAPADAAQLRGELTSLMVVLKTLEAAVREDTDDILMRPIVQDSLDALRTPIEELQLQTQPAKVRGVDRLTWPFKKARNVFLQSQIETRKTTLMVALQKEQRYLMVH
jgi:hypothetical protein